MLLLLLAAAAAGAGARSSLLGMTQKNLFFLGIPHKNGNIGNHEITITKQPLTLLFPLLPPQDEKEVFKGAKIVKVS